ncbi:urease accessory protein UreF [Blastochloris tepida]|nr:urease accessory UreF family protein [Blastochloris tepida]
MATITRTAIMSTATTRMAACPMVRTATMADAGGPAIAVPIELMVWLSPAFPVGAFAYSHGLEQAVERGWLATRADLEIWLSDLIAMGSLRTDQILLAAAWRAAAQGDDAGVCLANDWACALQPSAERHLETVTQGGSFVAAIRAAWPAPGLDALPALAERGIAYPVAVGAVAARHGVALEGTALAYGVAFVANLASAAIRLNIIGQTDGQRLIAALLPRLRDRAHHAPRFTLGDLGSATLRADLASLSHETQYSRIFRS